MGRAEKSLVIFFWCYFAVYFCCVLSLLLADEFSRLVYYILPFHLFGMALGFAMIFILCRDLYKRKFATRSSKVIWAILWAICWPSIFVYLYKHGFRPR